MTRRQRRDDWDKFVKTLERDITGTQRRGFKILKQLQLQERDKLKIDPIKNRMERIILWKTLERTREQG